MVRLPTRTALCAALLLTSSVALAQVQPPGAPAEGVQVQTRYGSPSQSTQLLTAQPPAQEAAAQGEGGQGTGAMAIEGDAVGPLVNTHIRGLHDGAADPLWLDNEVAYTGIIPTVRDSLPHISRTQRHGAEGRRNTLTWVGFQPFEGQTRVFIQTGRPAQYQVVESPDGMTVTVRLRDTAIEVSNFRRWIDASYFGRAVHRIETARSGDGVTEVRIALSRAAAYSVEGAGEYLYVDFAE